VASPVGANVLERYTLSIFRVEVAMLRSTVVYIGLEEGKDEGMGQSNTTYISQGSHNLISNDVKIK
jgi:hypothetical protein